ncbi:tRNA 5-methoxyuridine(34)/uridine 5-oxyacetic acid(34) synthase CmoB [Alteromonadaceae bacterium M269]|nr:tRNA 5-methoxyuridine(34)/uridine 5-oxyacetic acid(34) synthase CmoB [Alteromonadaceae bacterium M269]
MKVDWYQPLYQQLATSPLSAWLETLPAHMAEWQKKPHGEFTKWLKLLKKLPKTEVGQIELSDQVSFGSKQDIDEYTQKFIEGLLQQFKPWRKGPFHIHDIHIDTEWRSDWKWDRLVSHIKPLEGKHVLDVGCGNGYHMWRMLAQNPELVIGVDPTELFLTQFQAIKHFNPDPRIHLVPLGIEDMPPLGAFDCVFSMGVMYHRKSPMDFLVQLKQLLAPGGQLVLETLVVDGDKNTVLMAGERYAQMRNVWFLPSTLALEHWLDRLGFKNISTVDVSKTTVEEQRSTQWMTNHSLKDFLDPDDPYKTIEGEPAPVRAVIIAER